MDLDTSTTLDKRRTRAAFDAAAQSYDDHATLQRLVTDQALEALDVIKLSPHCVLEIGTGTGYGAAALRQRYKKAALTLLDLSSAMLAQARTKAPRWRHRQTYVCADAEALPLADACVDLIFSSLTFQWCAPLDAVFEECLRVLKPNGLLLFSSLGPDTLKELRAAWHTVDSDPRINTFIDMHDVGDALVRAGFASPVLECDPVTVNYASAFDVMRDLRGIGATNNLRERRRGLTTARQLKKMAAAYEPLRRDGRLPATYEVVYAHAWRPLPRERQQDGSTVATFPFAELKRRS